MQVFKIDASPKHFVDYCCIAIKIAIGNLCNVCLIHTEVDNRADRVAVFPIGPPGKPVWRAFMIFEIMERSTGQKFGFIHSLWAKPVLVVKKSVTS